MSHSPNIPGWEGSFPLGATLAADLGVPVRIGNDVDVATEAEFRLGAGRGSGRCSACSGAPAWVAAWC